MASELEKQLKELEKSQKKGILSEEEYQQRRAALIANGAHRPVNAGKSGPLKWGFMGCLGIIGAFSFVIVLIVVIAASSGGGGDDENDDIPAAAEERDVRVALTVDSTGTIFPDANDDKKSKVTILQIVDGAESANQFLQPAEGKKYYAIEVVVENVGTKEVSSLDWKMRDSSDNELEREYVSGVGGTELDLVYSDLTPGGKKQGWVVFEIDAAATAKWIRADPNPFLKNDLYFDAQ